MVIVTFNKDYANKYMTTVKGRRRITSETLYTEDVQDIDYCLDQVIVKIESSLSDEKENVLVVMNEPVITVVPETIIGGWTGGGSFSIDRGQKIRYLVTISYEAIRLGNVIPE